MTERWVRDMLRYVLWACTFGDREIGEAAAVPAHLVLYSNEDISLILELADEVQSTFRHLGSIEEWVFCQVCGEFGATMCEKVDLMFQMALKRADVLETIHDAAAQGVQRLEKLPDSLGGAQEAVHLAEQAMTPEALAVESEMKIQALKDALGDDYQEVVVKAETALAAAREQLSIVSAYDETPLETLYAWLPAESMGAASEGERSRVLSQHRWKVRRPSCSTSRPQPLRY